MVVSERGKPMNEDQTKIVKETQALLQQAFEKLETINLDEVEDDDTKDGIEEAQGDLESLKASIECLLEE